MAVTTATTWIPESEMATTEDVAAYSTAAHGVKEIISDAEQSPTPMVCTGFGWETFENKKQINDELKSKNAR